MSDIRTGDDVLVNHPYFGSVWLSDCYVDRGRVVGQVVADRMFGHNIMETMNFPLSCVRKVSRA
jgi:hypothetical protein